jgi:hypothetical protein
MTREEWLQRATDMLRPLFQEKAGVQVPADVKVSCGWPGGGSARKRIGECWPRSRSKAGVNEVFISPLLDDGQRVLDVLAHELVHAVDDCKSGHGRAFGRVARAIGLEGKLTATHAGDELKAFLAGLGLPQYPHAGLNPGGKASERSGERVKLTCADTGEVFYVSKRGFQALVTCPFCEGDCHAK